MNGKLSVTVRMLLREWGDILRLWWGDTSSFSENLLRGYSYHTWIVISLGVIVFIKMFPYNLRVANIHQVRINIVC